MTSEMDKNRSSSASNVPSDVCGFTTDYHGYSNPGNITCYRDSDGNDQCIWHRDEEGKSVSDLIDSRTEHEERLDGAILRGVDIDDNISFSQCNLYNADLTDSSVIGTDFSGAGLYKADFSEAKVRDADFSDAYLGYSSFRSVELLGNLFCNADLNDSKFKDIESHGDDFSDTVMSDAVFTNADLVKPDFTGAKLNHLDVSDTHFERANFSGANLWRADFTNVGLLSGDFSHANLTESWFTEVDLRDCNLNEADLTGARIEKSNLADATLVDSVSRGCYFSNTNLENAVLTRTDLREADVSGADLYQTQLADIRINSETDFGHKCSYETQDQSPGIAEDTTPLEAATWVYRRLETLHKENALADRAREYHVQKEEAQRKTYWRNWDNWDDIESLRTVLRNWNLPKALIYSANRWMTRHGESPYRVIGISLLSVLSWAILYPFAGIQDQEKEQPVTWANALDSSESLLEMMVNLSATLGESIYFSTVTFTTLGGAMRPLTWAKGLATVESFLGSLLMALLVFVLGRRATW